MDFEQSSIISGANSHIHIRIANAVGEVVMKKSTRLIESHQKFQQLN
jgi:hypothetical protein